MERPDPYYQELIQKARQTDIVEWVQENRPDLILRRVGREHTILGMDSIRIDGYKWKRHSGKGEVYRQGNAIDFLVEFCGMSKKQAIVTLTGVYLAGSIRPHSYEKPTAHKEKKEKEPGTFDELLDLREFREFDINDLELHSSQKRVIAYLTKHRGIAPDVALGEIKAGNLFEEVTSRQDTQTGKTKQIHNGIFAMRDENGVIVGAEAIGTLSYREARFKSIKAGSKQGYGYNTGARQDPRYMLFFEGAIDLLSFITIKKSQSKSLAGCLLVSMAGVKPGVVSHMMEVFGQSAQPVFCVDNDQAGTEFLTSTLPDYPNARVHLPDGDYKDWNDQLTGKKIES